MKILMIKTSAIGDVLQTFAAASYLRYRFPAAHIAWAVEAPIAPLLKAHPALNAIIPIDTKSWRKNPVSKKTWKEVREQIHTLRQVEYDLIIDFQANTKSSFVTACARGKVKLGFDRAGVAEWPNLLVTTHKHPVPMHIGGQERYLQLVQSYFKDPLPFEIPATSLHITSQEANRLETLKKEVPLGRKAILICFGSRWKNKQVPETLWHTLLTQLAQETAVFYSFIFSTPEEKAQAERLANSFPGYSRTVGQLSLPLWQAVMASSDLVITVDSAALHLCATTLTPSWSFFGASSAQFYKPSGPQHRALQGLCPYGQTFTKRCPQLRTCKTGACMHSFKLQDFSS